jgi:mono/diheme cytochrome c family protein
MRPSLGLTSGTVGLLLLTPLSVAGGQTATPQAVDAGRALFEASCAACHSLGDERLVGPGLAGIGERRERTWLTGFITAPDRMLADGDTVALQLLAEYQVPMPNLGISVAEAESILEYLATGSSPPTSAQAAEPATSGDAGRGRMLFTGENGFENGGAACMSCHTVDGLGRVGGGTLAKDLTHVATTYGGSLGAVLEATPFPVMQEIYGARALTAAEIADISAFLMDVNQRETARGASPVLFLMAGLVGAVFLLALAGAIWRGRLREVREPLIGGSR